MTSPTFTERRLYRLAALLQGFQSVQGTPVSNFTTAASRAMWAREVELAPGIVKADEQGTTGTSRKRGEARYMVDRRPTLRFLGGATPKNLEWLLRSWGGAWTGSPTLTLGLTENINEFATLGLVEKAPAGGGNTQKFIRAYDAWAHKVRLFMESGLSALDVEADFACRDFDRTPLNALGGITLPATFGPPAIDVFAPHGFRLFRDPAGANVSVAVKRMEIVLEHGLLHEAYNDVAPQVVKEGHTKIGVNFTGVWADETYGVETDAETVATVFRRFKAEWTSGAKSFKMDLRNVDFTPSPTGWRDGQFREFTVEGEAYLDASDNYVSFELVP